MRCGVQRLWFISAVGCFIGLCLYLSLFRKGFDSTRPGFLYQLLQRPTVDGHSVPTMPGNMSHVKAPQLDTQKCQAAYSRNFSAAKFQIAGYNHTHVSDCRLPLCDLCNNHVPVNVLTCDVPADKRVTEKVTVIVKTSQRLTEIMRLIRSLHRYYPGLKVVVADDEANVTISKNPATQRERQRLWQDFLSESNGLVQHIILPGDPGISKGRNAALRLVKTKYFLQVDDDVYAGEQTNISKMVDILDRTDLTMVAGVQFTEGTPKGRNDGRCHWSGIVRFHPSNQSNQIEIFKYNDMAYEEVRFFPSCYVVDFADNCFLGRTEQVLQFGGFDEHFPVEPEHADFHLAARKSGYKLAYCTDILFRHRAPNYTLRKHRHAVFARKFQQYYAYKWKIQMNESNKWFKKCKAAKYIYKVPLSP